MANDITVSVTGIDETLRAMDDLARSIAPGGGLRDVMGIAAGMTHRYLMGLGKDRPPIGETGVLPVISGRLKNSLYWTVQAAGDGVNGLVASNIAYGADVEARRQFMDKTAKDMERPVNDLFTAWLGRRTR